MSRHLTQARVVIVAAVVMALVAAACNPTGPDPTEASISAETGPYAIATTTVTSAEATGFGGAEIYYPTDPGPFGALAIVPGYQARRSTMSWFGSRLASQGFVVMSIDTNSTIDNAPSRGGQLLAALDYLTTTSSVAGQVDPNRLSVMGWSMGGGGALTAAAERPSIKASIPLAPFINNNQDWSTMTVPTMMIL